MSLLVILSFCFTGIVALQLNMNNVTTMLSNNNTLLMCSYILEQDEILTIGILAYNKSENTFEHIAGYRPNQTAEILTYGAYLMGRVTLSNLTRTSTQAYILFHEIRCIDETMYKCGITYLDKGLKLLQVESSEVNISITVPPEKPDTLYMTDTFALFKETDNATFICEGNVGNPKGKLIWQTQRKGENVSKVNTDIQTDYIKIEKYCSYVEISSLTITLSDKDNQAVISCAEESLMNNTTMVRYSQPVNVLFKARTPRIMKFPNISTYPEGIDIIILTCISHGNPQPTYVWYFNEALTHVGSVLNIENGRRSQSGLYICNASNSYSGTTFVASYSIDIQIIKNTETSGISSNDSKIKATYIIGIVCGVLAVIVIPFVVWILYNHKRGLINKRNNSTETNNPEPHYATVAETEYVRPGQPYNHEYNKISKSKKRESGHIQSTESEQPQQNTDRPSEDLNSSTNSYMKMDRPSGDLNSSTNSYINKGNPSEDLNSRTHSYINTDIPSGDLNSSTNSYTKMDRPSGDLSSSTNSYINTDRPSGDLNSRTISYINTDRPSEDLNSNTNSYINTYI